ncbi:3-oxoacyl-ACP synthase [Mucilaginibacter terrenus]|uniref:3-oxoacyl-ACP synthase n=1 Tax=Mucilaginibacter terrenus TaxID=2482727 RepID=A0A3E2NJZ6_9SPHI|nr:3-oxoacyl-ACP synthase [Mucilaginibacter terrenus]RFZ81261.1 3-oxoacyl-ACP synthase [Mucilaginibacter terrenus]
MTINIKEQLHTLCLSYVKQRLKAAEQAIAEAQEAANNDTKSSAGDKYETGREMAQQETNRNLSQLNEANKLLVALNQIGYKTSSDTVDAGSLVTTDNGIFYISISVGTLNFEEKSYFAVSPASPIGYKLKGKTAGEEINLNGKIYKILSVV